MGVDFESTDLTARIRARRRAAVAAGEVEPARVGEHLIAGTDPGATIALDRLAQAAEFRGRREQQQQVLDIEYLPGEREALALAPEDGGDRIEDESELEDALGGHLEPEDEAPPEYVAQDIADDAVLAERQFAEGILTAPTDAPMRLAVIEEQLADAQEQLTGIANALKMIAEAIGELPGDTAQKVMRVEAFRSISASALPVEQRKHIGLIRRFFRWIY